MKTKMRIGLLALVILGLASCSKSSQLESEIPKEEIIEMEKSTETLKEDVKVLEEDINSLESDIDSLLEGI